MDVMDRNLRAILHALIIGGEDGGRCGDEGKFLQVSQVRQGDFPGGSLSLGRVEDST